MFSMARSLRLFQALLLLHAMKPAVSDRHGFIYNGFQGVDLSLNGLAAIESNGLLQLTSKTDQQFGHAFYPDPVQFKNSSDGNVFSFSSTFVIGILSEYPDLGGHGIAFTISPSTELPGAARGRYLGLFNISNNGNSSNHVFAIEFDTITDPEFGDIDNNHVGIDINGLNSSTSATAAYFKNGERNIINLISGEPIQAWVDYNGVDKQLDVTLSPFKIPKPERPLFSSNLDLSEILLDSMFMGFSAATGSISTSHFVLGWSFNMNNQAQELDLSHLPHLPRRGSRAGIDKSYKIGLPIASAIFLLTAILGTLYMIRKKKYAEIFEEWENEYITHRFSYKDLFIATKGFNEKEVLGRGGFGSVYRGVLPTSKVEVAVKRLSHDSQQGFKEFVAEIATVGRLRHRNLVKFLGYCRRTGELLLVYDFMVNGSLDSFIFDQQKSVLSWDQRLRILRDVACGLLYLHEEWEQVVVHRDVKASNILLDAYLNGRLGDFGLARLCDHGSNPQTTHVVGTMGYVAPELARTGRATTGSDVFALGALLLEVACGRRPVDPEASAEKLVLVDWVVSCWKRGVILECADMKLGGDYVVEEMELVLKLGLLCSHPVAELRPGMRQVMQFLDGDADLPEMALEGMSRRSGFHGVGEGGIEDIIISYPSSLDMCTHSLSGSGSFPVSRVGCTRTETS